MADYRHVKSDVHRALESFHGPGPVARRAITAADRVPAIGAAVKYFAYRMHGRDLARPIKQFSRKWLRGRSLAADHLRIHASGEVYMRVAQAEDLFDRLLRVVGFRRFHLTLSHLWPYVEYVVESRVESAQQTMNMLRARQSRAATRAERRACRAAIREERAKCRRARFLIFVLRRALARPLYKAAGLDMPPSSRALLEIAREVLPTLRPHGELAIYVGEALRELRAGVDLFVSLAPAGCMVTSMAEMLTPRILQAAGGNPGRIQSLFSADGDINDELLQLALLKALGPERSWQAADSGDTATASL
jgi:hypothetical protein